MTEDTPEGTPLSTYSEAHRRYYQRHKPLIHARRRKYNNAYKRWYYNKHREEILAQRKAKRDEERIRRLVEREKILQAQNRLQEAEDTKRYLDQLRTGASHIHNPEE